jgi:hypothetical protein
VNHKGWVYDLVKENKLGISCLPQKLESAFVELENLENHPEKIVQMSRNSRQLAEKYFSKEIAVARLNQVIQPSDSPTQLGDEVYILTA